IRPGPTPDVESAPAADGHHLPRHAYLAGRLPPRASGAQPARHKPPEEHPMMIDPRGPRFGAVITMVVFVVVLITSSAWLLAVQALFFAIGGGLGLPRSPYGLLYRWLIRPR